MGNNSSSIGIIGGGLAGLSTAVALADRGCRVELFESRPRLGGRAGAFWEPAVAGWIDFGQHVLMACCSQMLHFCRQTGLNQFLCRYRQLYFLDQQGQTYRVQAACWLPPPLHLAPSFCRLGLLSYQDRLRVIRGLIRLIQTSQPPEKMEEMTFGQWLLAQGQTPSSIQRFWTPVVLSALAELPERAAFSVARKVFLEGFLATRQGYQILRPTLPWGQLLDGYLGKWLTERAVVVHRRMPVRLLEGDDQEVDHLVLKDGSRKKFDFYILAVPWRQAGGLLAPAIQQAIPQVGQAAQLQPGAITTWHLWLDRPITSLPHTAVVGKGIQWVFAGIGASSKPQPTLQMPSCAGTEPSCSGPEPGISPLAGTRYRYENGPNPPTPILGETFPPALPKEGRNWYYYQVVLSATHALPASSIPQTIEDLRQELSEIFPAAKEAKVLAYRRVKMAEAVFSPQAGVERIRPNQQTPIRNLALAGDWTATGWPATMESAVRSGYQAAKVVLKQMQLG